jgi:hypothetical protein
VLTAQLDRRDPLDLKALLVPPDLRVLMERREQQDRRVLLASPAQLAPLVRQDLLVLTARTARPVPPALPVPLAVLAPLVR